MNTSPITASRDIPGWLLSFLKQYGITVLLAMFSLFLTVEPTMADAVTWQAKNPISLNAWLSHLSHWSAGHMMWDLIVFIILGGLLERSDRKLLIAILVLVPPAIAFSVLLSGDHLSYRGLSGLDSALYGAVVIHAAKTGRIGIITTCIALGLFAGKSLFEILSGSAVFVSDLPSGVSSVPWAHFSGIAVGIIAFCLVNLARVLFKKKIDGHSNENREDEESCSKDTSCHADLRDTGCV